MQAETRSTPNLEAVIFFGGPSNERGVSLHSARTFYDHKPEGVSVLSWVYIDHEWKAWAVPPFWLYHNTPDDFVQMAKTEALGGPWNLAQARGFAYGEPHRITELIELARATPDEERKSQGGFQRGLGRALERLRDYIESKSNQAPALRPLAIPLVHGPFGEDGTLQALFEIMGLRYLGTSYENCSELFDKYSAFEATRGCMPEIRKAIDFPAKRHIPKAAESEESDAPRLDPYDRVAPVKVTVGDILSDGNKSPEQTLATLAQRREKFGDFRHGYLIKPARSGSSIGVRKCLSAAECMVAIKEEALDYKQTAKLNQAEYEQLVFLIEPFHSGSEFTIIVLEPPAGEPVALLPTEIKKKGVFDFFMKYHPTTDVEYICPPGFPPNVTAAIRSAAERLFKKLKMRHFARIDGWVDDNESVYFSDFNLISGMDHGSLLFQQTAKIGLTHTDTLRRLLQLAYPEWEPPESGVEPCRDQRRPLAVLFGGESSEQQISVHSGVNVWLKMVRSRRWNPTPYLLVEREEQPWVWRLPYACALFGTTDNIENACLRELSEPPYIQSMVREIRGSLGMSQEPLTPAPVRMPLASFLASLGGEKADEKTDQKTDEKAGENTVVFNTVHGGIGENGWLRGQMDRVEVRSTGPRAETYRLCIDKNALLDSIERGVESHNAQVGSLKVKRLPCEIRRAEELLRRVQPPSHADSIFSFSSAYLDRCKQVLTKIKQDIDEKVAKQGLTLSTDTIVVKPTADGSSVGVATLRDEWRLAVYLWALGNSLDRIPLCFWTRPKSFPWGDRESQPAGEDAAAAPDQPREEGSRVQFIPMPGDRRPEELMFEPWVETPTEEDVLRRFAEPNTDLAKDYVELTCGMINALALTPSMAVGDSSGILSQTNKFMKGDGMNFTPIPHEWALTDGGRHDPAKLSAAFEAVATALGLESVTRIDAFYSCRHNVLFVLEINANPALTPATVLFHEAAAGSDLKRRHQTIYSQGKQDGNEGIDAEGLMPREFLEFVLSPFDGKRDFTKTDQGG